MSLTDTMGSLTVASKGQYMTGVSTDIGTSFVRPAGRVGDVLHARAVLTGMGETTGCLTTGTNPISCP
jgi:acyl-coenzyme A thioesterase 13